MGSFSIVNPSGARRPFLYPGPWTLQIESWGLVLVWGLGWGLGCGLSHVDRPSCGRQVWGLGAWAWVGAWIGRLGLCWGMWFGLHGSLNIGPWTLDLGIRRNIDISMVSKVF